MYMCNTQARIHCIIHLRRIPERRWRSRSSTHTYVQDVLAGVHACSRARSKYARNRRAADTRLRKTEKLLRRRSRGVTRLRGFVWPRYTHYRGFPRKLPKTRCNNSRIRSADYFFFSTQLTYHAVSYPSKRDKIVSKFCGFHVKFVYVW